MTVVDSSSGRFGEFGGRFVPEAWLRRSNSASLMET
jgi:tryptophan synthase beta subunit